MIISRKEDWGKVEYNTVNHTFNIKPTKEFEKNRQTPYVSNPLLLNIDLTFDCNMKCKHCVAKDFEMHKVGDLVISEKLINWINESPFFVVVITGGEPLLPKKRDDLISLLKRIDKGIIIDTNGTIRPDKELLKIIKQKNILVRISLDAVRPQTETIFRTLGKKKEADRELYFKKLENIDWFKSKGINLAIQSVLHKRNDESMLRIPEYLKQKSIKKWYIQRFIPSHLAKKEELLKEADYIDILRKLKKKCKKYNIKCFTKIDKRHNSVFLLIGDGKIYTQGDKPGQKILIGNINSEIKYFLYVSSSDHSARYYGEQIIDRE